VEIPLRLTAHIFKPLTQFVLF